MHAALVPNSKTEQILRVQALRDLKRTASVSPKDSENTEARGDARPTTQAWTNNWERSWGRFTK